MFKNLKKNRPVYMYAMKWTHRLLFRQLAESNYLDEDTHIVISFLERRDKSQQSSKQATYV